MSIRNLKPEVIDILKEQGFTEEDIEKGILSNANLWWANLRDANLRDANLSGANLSGANLSGAKNLTQEQLDEAFGDENTILPEGLTIKTKE